jgi:hypothetical protein
MEDNKQGDRAYRAERKAKVMRLAADLRSSESRLKEFEKEPNKTAQGYGLQLTEEEAATISAIAGTQELSGEALSSVSGGLAFFDNNCGCEPN